MTTTTAADQVSRILGGPQEEKFLNSFFVLYKTARLLDENNATFKNQSRGFIEQLTDLQQQGGDVLVKTVGQRYFVNDRLVRFDDQGMSGAASVVKEWKTLGMGGVRFKVGIEPAEVERFFTVITAVKPNSQNLESLAISLKTHSLANVELLSVVKEGDDESAIPEEVRRRFRTAARGTFFKAMSVVQEAVVGVANDREINVSKTKRVVHSLIEQITQDESSLIELTAIKDFDDYTYAHSTNVCVYALTVGVRLGLDRSRLSQLGFTALFHDVGKVKLPADLISKPDAYDEDDWIQMQRHPLLGAKSILRNMPLEEHTARACRGAFEHHINNDLTGYPSLRYEKREPNLFSQIISIVDTFDALTSGRVYLRKAISPDEVLKKMRYQMKIKFEPFLLQIFNKIVGVYPAGSLVLLSTDEIALVLTNNVSDRARPYVKIVGDRHGISDQPEWVDLSLDENSNREIIRLVDPDRYELDVKEFILRD